MGRGAALMKYDASAHETGQSVLNDLAESYREMAADCEREAEAKEWTESLVADVASDEGYGL